ncbi:MAG: DUF2321 domain-containing protein [Anaerovoracaceae bacterium]|nr:DUF2321 domain-containing protein [Anaerovoracaceae bacterium]
MSYFYVQSCSDGHFIITNRRLRQGDTCRKCGLPLIDKCPQCGEYIRKWTLYGATPMLPGKRDYRLPDACEKCGAAFPWKRDDEQSKGDFNGQGITVEGYDAGQRRSLANKKSI